MPHNYNSGLLTLFTHCDLNSRSPKFTEPLLYTYIWKINTIYRGSKQICNECCLPLSTALMSNAVKKDRIAHQLHSQHSHVQKPRASPIRCSKLIVRCNFQSAVSSSFLLLNIFLLHAFPTAPDLLSNLSSLPYTLMHYVLDLISPHSF